MTARARTGRWAGCSHPRRHAGETSPTPKKGREVAAAFSPGDPQVQECRGVPDLGSPSSGWNWAQGCGRTAGAGGRGGDAVEGGAGEARGWRRRSSRQRGWGRRPPGGRGAREGAGIVCRVGGC